MPDIEAFIRMKGEKGFSHTWLGFLCIGIPLGILLSFVFHNIIRDPFITHLPASLQKRFLKFKSFDWNKRFKEHWIVVVASLIIGGATHFFWDAFSHYDGAFIKMFPELKGNIDLPNGTELEIPYLIQYINSLLGILIIVMVIWKMPADKSMATANSKRLKFWLSVIAITASIFALKLIFTASHQPDNLLIALISAFLIGIGFTAFVFRTRHSE